MANAFDRIGRFFAEAVPDWVRRMSPARSWRTYSVGNATVGLTSPEDALKIATVWRCVSLVSQSVAMLPWQVFKQDAKGQGVRQPNNPVEWLLHRQASREMTAFVFKRTIKSHAMLWGNGYAEIERDGANRPAALHLLDPSRVTPGRLTNGEIGYKVLQADGTSVILAAADVYHVHGLGFDGIRGYSVLEYSAPTLALPLALNRSLAKFFRDGFRPMGFLKTKGKLGIEAFAALEKRIAQASGVNNAWQALPLDQDMEWQPLSVSPEEADIVDLQKLTSIDICFAPGTPIVTTTGLKPIESVREGELVLTHRGRWRPVRAVMRRDYVGPMVEVSGKGLHPVKSTANHPFYAQPVKMRRSGAMVATGPAQWVEAANLCAIQRFAARNVSRKPHHRLTMPRLGIESLHMVDLATWAPDGAIVTDDTVTPSTHWRANAALRNICLDYDLGWLCGLYAADGSASNRQVVFYLGAHEIDLVEATRDRVAKTFGLSIGVHLLGNCARVTMQSHAAIAAMFKEFGASAPEKRLPEWCMRGSSEFRRGLLDGLVDGDGHRSGNVVQLRTTSEALAWQTRILLWAAGTNSCLMESAAMAWAIGDRSGMALPIKTVAWQAERVRPGSMGIESEYVHIVLDSVERSTYCGAVYNLEVEEDESYTTAGGCVHNCRLFDVPPHMAFDLERATFSNIESQGRDFLTYGLLPSIIQMEQEANHKLLTSNFGGLYSKMNFNAIVRADIEKRGGFYQLMLGAGAMNINEVRALEDLNDIGPDGDIYVRQVQYQPIGTELAPQPVTPAKPNDPNTPPPPKKNGDARAHRRNGSA